MDSLLEPHFREFSYESTVTEAGKPVPIRIRSATINDGAGTAALVILFAQGTFSATPQDFRQAIERVGT